ncbi:non-ribosomal peptide synthetase [Rhizobium sp. BE258]|uniref:non-ribosomal peptide synthetase n=1 Tax=Rhizobium sp. BE258 TaxID=2817722 RepID=UPI00285A3752|nr:non-ribosomal peptide synthetase [Rhizobium sp. BE258]MDR7144118.1 amino acid adenylation domain-containing protein [Rhizobium sp. BE258]
MTGLAYTETAETQDIGHYDRDRGLPAIVHGHALRNPAATALVFGNSQLSYGELDTISDALAVMLQERGVVRGDVVGLLLPRSLETVVCMLAILKAGAAYLPLDPAYPAEHLDYVIAECAPKIIFAETSSVPKLALIPGLETKTLDARAAIADASAARPAVQPAGQPCGCDAAYVMFTSGSTGRPKGVVVPHRGLSNLILDQRHNILTTKDVVLHALTISFDASMLEIWSALLNGCKLVGMLDVNFSVSRLCELIEEHGVTFHASTPGLFNLMADYGQERMQSLRHVIYGGDVGSVTHSLRFMQSHPNCRVSNVYGPTEATVLVTAYSIPADFKGSELPIGKAIAHTEIRILDDELREVAYGTEGQIAIGGDGLALGYFNRPELTRERFVIVDTRDGPVRCYLTGDLGTMDADGMVYFRGRRDRQVKINGKRIELDEIETALRSDTRLAEAAVVCQVMGPELKQMIAYLCPREDLRGRDQELTRDVMAALRGRLPAFMIPNSIVVIDEMPLTRSGKIDRSKLLAPPPEAVPGSLDLTAKSGGEAMLTRLWREALGNKPVDADTNFFDLGGTSLQLMQVHARIEAELGRAIPVVLLFKHSTIRELSRFLDGKLDSSARGTAAAQRAEQQRNNMARFRRNTK